MWNPAAVFLSLLLLWIACSAGTASPQGEPQLDSSSLSETATVVKHPAEPPPFRNKYNIALHAQVAPDPKQIVGSVITTDGLRAALLQREDVDQVHVFYPFKYEDIFVAKWDIVIIEGWFLMIHDFIQIVRNHSPQAVVLFYCLDPSFPGLDEAVIYDVDGYLTNSRAVQQILQRVAPTEYVPLAADPVLMRPSADAQQTGNAHSERTQSVVFVGAGGRMLEYKPELLSAVQAALPFGLRLYGMGWGEMQLEGIREAYGGILPRWDIARTYASARVVLGSTIQSQKDQGMVNNRVFEAMSCGAVVLSDHSPALESIAEGTVLFANSSADITRHLQWAQDHPQELALLGARARALILRKHTWGHRAVQILSMANDLRAKRASGAHCCTRVNCPSMAWVTSSRAANHTDYSNIVRIHIHANVCRQYRIQMFSEEDFVARLARDDAEQFLGGFEVVWAVAAALDSLHLRLAGLEQLHVRSRVKGTAKGFGRQQKWMLYLLGYDEALVPKLLEPDPQQQRRQLFNSWDVVMFRSRVEMASFRALYHRLTGAELCGAGLRCEHLFAFDASLGLEASPEASSTSIEPFFTVVKPRKDPAAAAAAAAAAAVNAAGRSDVKAGELPPMSSPSSGKSVAPVSSGAIVVCFIRYSNLCTLEQRRALVKSTSSDRADDQGQGQGQGQGQRQEQEQSDLDYHLLLVGGTWDEWLDVPGVVSAVEPFPFPYGASNGGAAVQPQAANNLHRVIHVPSGRATWLPHALFASAPVVYLMHGSPAVQTVGVGSPSPSPDLTGSFTVHPTSEDVTWPILLVGVLGYRSISPLAPAPPPHGESPSDNGEARARARASEGPTPSPSPTALRLHQHNDLLVRLAGDSVRQWTAPFLARSASRVLCKVHGLGSGATTIEVHPKGVSLFDFTERRHDNGEDIDKDKDRDRERESEREQGGVEIGGQVRIQRQQQRHARTLEARMDLVMELRTENFLLGRDGDCCFSWSAPAPAPAPEVSASASSSSSASASASASESPLPAGGTSPHRAANAFERNVSSNRTCLLRQDQPDVRVRIAIFTNSSGPVCSNGEASSTAGRLKAGADTDSDSDICGFRSFIARSSIDIYLRGNMFADHVAWIRIPLQSFLDASATDHLSSLPLLAEGEGGAGQGPSPLSFEVSV